MGGSTSHRYEAVFILFLENGPFLPSFVYFGSSQTIFRIKTGAFISIGTQIVEIESEHADDLTTRSDR